MRFFLVFALAYLHTFPLQGEHQEHGSNEKPTLYDGNRARVWQEEEEELYCGEHEHPRHSHHHRHCEGHGCSNYNQFHDNPHKDNPPLMR